MRLASYNIENLFERVIPMNDTDWAAGRDALAAWSELNAIFAKPTYSAADHKRMLALLDQLGLARSDESRLAYLRQNRGRFRGRRGGRLTIVAGGRDDWVGWVDLKTEAVNDVAIANTARIIGLLGADILAVIEAESRPSLLRFSEQVLHQFVPDPYTHIMLVDGNDTRGIDVGLLAREGWPIRSIISHVDDRNDAGNRLFSRDCPEYEIALPDGGSLWILVNHFKSQGYGRAAESDARRRAQAARVRALYEARVTAGAELVVILGDLNDTPGSKPLEPLLGDGMLRDISQHPRFNSDGRPGTWRNGTKANKLDYIILSPALWERVTEAGVERRGVWGGKNGTLFPHLPEITKEEEAASDHAAIWAELDLR